MLIDKQVKKNIIYEISYKNIMVKYIVIRYNPVKWYWAPLTEFVSTKLPLLQNEMLTYLLSMI